jgi:hypothetical protein
VPDIGAVFKSGWSWMGVIALGVGWGFIANRLQGGADTIMFFISSYLGVAALTKLAMRFRLLATIAVAIPVWLAWLFGLVAWPMDLRHGSDLYLALYLVATALVFGLGALARFRCLKSYGR